MWVYFLAKYDQRSYITSIEAFLFVFFSIGIVPMDKWSSNEKPGFGFDF